MNAAYDDHAGMDFQPSAIFSANAWTQAMPTSRDFEPSMPSWMAPKSIEPARNPLDLRAPEAPAP
ncbi:MAG TPA: hypothetical protein ENK57_11220, partial [Polyangiaceae bacterium]|nr:hypothetical protein [Polyangiaceae bacterium]